MSLFHHFTIYTHPKLLVVLCLGFSSGLPLLLVGSTLGAWLFESGIDKKTIGLFALVSLPYSFNFLWAPVVDHVPIPFFTRRLGRRRSWMLLFQTGLLCSIAAFAFADPLESTAMIAWIAVMIAFFSASQDIVIDAYRTEYLDKTQYGEGASIAVFGYRLGMLTAGAGALALADQTVWQLVYLIMAAAMLVGMLTVLIAGEPEISSLRGSDEGADEAIQSGLPRSDDVLARNDTSMKHWLYTAVIMPFEDFMKRHPQWLLILLLILFYRMPDGFIGFITTPFFLDIGFSKSQVAAIAKIYGFGATLAGAFIGGALIHKLGSIRCLWYFLLFQILTNLTYVSLSLLGPDPYYLMFAISMDNLSGGMITAVAVAYMMSLCNLTYTATQYALLSSLASLASKTMAGWAGVVADIHGWSAMFGLSAILGIPALLVLFLLRRRLAG